MCCQVGHHHQGWIHHKQREAVDMEEPSETTICGCEAVDTVECGHDPGVGDTDLDPLPRGVHWCVRVVVACKAVVAPVGCVECEIGQLAHQQHRPYV